MITMKDSSHHRGQENESVRPHGVGRVNRDGPSDEELVRRAQREDRWAQEMIFRRYVSSVARVTTRLLGPDPDVDDIVQDCFAAGLRSLERLRDPQALRPWLLGIAVNLTRKCIRQRRLRRMLGLHNSAFESALATQASTGLSQEQLAELQLLDRVLAALPADERITWTLRHVEGESLAEIVDITGRSLATVKRKIAAAEVKIAARLKGGLR